VSTIATDDVSVLRVVYVPRLGQIHVGEPTVDVIQRVVRAARKAYAPRAVRFAAALAADETTTERRRPVEA
jgi:hypothetical protein